MKFLSLLAFFIAQHLSQAQSPFNYGKSRNLYFLSQHDIRRMGIKHIYTITATPEEGSWEFFDINFTDSTAFHNNWCKALDDNSRILPLDSLILSSESYINGYYYSFANGKITQVGMDGMGALCHWSYSFRKNHSIATEWCKYQKGYREKKVVYFPNGLVNYETCCRTIDTDEKVIPNSFQDTTYYSYDSVGRVVGYKKKKLKNNITPIFSQLVPKHVKTYNQSYVNKTEFEKYFRQLLRYQPKIILFEIYRNAVVVFQFDPKRKKYIEMEDIQLE
jgi:hypothetical protein